MRLLTRTTQDARFRGVLHLSGGALASTVIGVLTVPLVARWYGPAAFGLSAGVVLAAGLASTVISGRYEVGALVADHTPEGEAEAIALSRLATTVALASSLVILLTTVVVVGIWGETSPAWLTLGPLALLTVLSSIQRVTDTRHARFALITGLAVTRSVSFAAAAWWLSGSFAVVSRELALCSAYMLAALPSTGRAIHLLTRTATWKDGHSPAKINYRKLARAHSRYPLYQAPAAALNNLSSSIFGLTLGGVYGATALGAYSVATRLTLLPVTLVGAPLSTVYAREAVVSRQDAERAAGWYRRALGASFLTGVLATPLLAGLVPFLVSLLGEEWLGIGAFVLATLPLMLAQLTSGPANFALMAYHAQRALLLWRLALAFSPLSLLLAARWAGVPAAGSVAAASLLLWVLALAYARYALVSVIRRTA